MFLLHIHYFHTSDDNVIVVHVKYGDKGYVVETLKGILDPGELILNALKLAIKWDCCLIGVEDTGYQQRSEGAHVWNSSHHILSRMPSSA